MKRYLKHATILKMDGTEPIIDGGLCMEDGIITYVGAHKEDMQAEEVIDMKGAVVMPALGKWAHPSAHDAHAQLCRRT